MNHLRIQRPQHLSFEPELANEKRAGGYIEHRAGKRFI